MDQNNNNFLDSRTLVAILLVGVVWFGWQQYVNKKYGNSNVESSVQQSENSRDFTLSKLKSSEISQLDTEKNIEKSEVVQTETFFSYNNSQTQLQLSSRGMGLKKVFLSNFTDKDKNFITFSGGEYGLFSTIIKGKPVDFQITNNGSGIFIGVSEFDGIKIEKRMVFSENYRVDIETKISTQNGKLPNLEISIEDSRKEFEKSGFLSSSPTEVQEFFVINNEGEKEYKLSLKDDEVLSASLNQTFLAGINSHYFNASYIDKSELVPSFLINQKPKDPFLKGKLIYSFVADQTSLTLKGIGYIGPKDIGVLEKVDPLLLKLVKFGFFSAIAKPLLIMMKWINSVLGNWGWSIILLTLIVRLIVMPLHIMSFKSMKSMQKVQPLIQKLRERYKEDQLTLNKEMMDLMKKNKVNPLGGCLPMLLQIPVFFALYRVFSESIELYQSPFIFWIHDLSQRDPFFVLPVLMGIVMFAQQKMTPTTMDPAQAKIMQFMPLVFSFMMISLPSALTLYMFVSTFFGILQQYLFLRDKQSSLLVK